MEHHQSSRRHFLVLRLTVSGADNVEDARVVAQLAAGQRVHRLLTMEIVGGQHMEVDLIGDDELEDGKLL